MTEFNSSGQIVFNQSVPFRLTRNIRNLLDPLLIDGVYAGVLTSSAMCFAHYSDQLKNLITLHMRDELIALNSPSEYFDGENERKKEEAELRKKIKVATESNTNSIIDRLKGVAPSLPTEKDKVFEVHCSQLTSRFTLSTRKF